MKRSELRNIKECADSERFQEESWVGHARFEGRAGITPSNFYQVQKAESKGDSNYGTDAKHERWI